MRIVMLGTSLNTKGGVASVVKIYRDSGLFERRSVTYIPTHCDGNRLTKIWIFMIALRKFFSIVAAGNADLVHVHMASRTSFWRKVLFILPAFVLDVPVILHLHGAEFRIFAEQELGRHRRHFVQWVFGRCATVVVLSPQWKLWVDGFSPACASKVIYNPVIPPESTKIKRDGSKFNLLFLGRLGRRKGFYDLLLSLSNVRLKNSSVRLYAGGDGVTEDLRKEIERLGLSDVVTLVGWVSGREKERLILNSDAYILPSYNEGLPMSILEAMSWGLPVISTTVGGIPEAIRDGVEGILFTPGDVPALTEAISKLQSDHMLANEMGNSARMRIEECFSSKVVIPQIESLYLSIFSGRQS